MTSAPTDDLKRRLILLASCLTVFLVALDVTVINLALPSIQRDFEVTLVERGWVIKAYTLTFAVLVIVGGKLGDIFGRKRFLVVGAVLFAVGSMVGFFSMDIETLLAARVIQALGSAAMMPGSLSVLTAAYQNRNWAPPSAFGKHRRAGSSQVRSSAEPSPRLLECALSSCLTYL